MRRFGRGHAGSSTSSTAVSPYHRTMYSMLFPQFLHLMELKIGRLCTDVHCVQYFVGSSCPTAVRFCSGSSFFSAYSSVMSDDPSLCRTTGLARSGKTAWSSVLVDHIRIFRYFQHFVWSCGVLQQFFVRASSESVGLLFGKCRKRLSDYRTSLAVARISFRRTVLSKSSFSRFFIISCPWLAVFLVVSHNVTVST